MAPIPDHQSPLLLLKRRWLWLAAFYVLAILAVYGVLRRADFGSAPQWLGQTAVLAAYCLWLVWGHLPENHRSLPVTEPAEAPVTSTGSVTVLPTFGLGNGLTLLRGLFVSMVAGFLFIPWPGGWLAWLPALLYTIAAIADFFDGYVARITNHATQLGARLDMEFDGLGMLVVSLLAVWFGQLPWWYLLIGLARYVFVAGMWLRQKRGLPNHTMPPSWHRRIFAGFQMGFMSVVLWPILPAVMATIAGTIFALATSASFLRDWLVVVGWLDPQSSQYQRRQQQLYHLFSLQLPPVFRLIFAACGLALISQLNTPWQPSNWMALFTSWHLPGVAFIASFFALTGLLAAVMITLGMMGRTMALVVMFPIGFEMATTDASWLNGMAMVCATLIFLLGTGAFSVWQPEERFLVRRAGE
ncbi:MAG: CDP-alcohol phosphatidyltransferase family protein [Anaerolineae bacterium]|nr:CDP-alcohol phosphatidyltransferase family protein [Anaerolineae bacterium]